MITSSEYPEHRFYMYGDSIYMKQNIKTNTFNISYVNFLRDFDRIFNINCMDVVGVILKPILSEYLKYDNLSIGTPLCVGVGLIEQKLMKD